MHVSVGGMPANADVSTDVWQYRQSSPSPRTWCSWLNGTGWWRDVDPRRYVRRLKDQIPTNGSAITRRNRAPKMLTREIVFVLG